MTLKSRLVPFIIVAAVGALLAIGSPASAANPSPSPSPTGPAPGTYITYAGMLTTTFFNKDGQTNPQPPTNFTVSIFCDAVTGCVLGRVRLGRTYTWPITGASGSWTLNNSGSVCQGSLYIAGGTLTAQATATTFTAHVHSDISPDENCDGAITYASGYDVVYAGKYSAGDACVLTGVTCAPKSTLVPVSVVVSVNTPRSVATPSVLSALPTPSETLSPGQLALAAALTIVLVILMAFPTQLLNRAVETGSDRISAFVRRRHWRKDADIAVDSPSKPLRGLLPASLGVLAAGIISAFVDPKFGFDVASIRTLISILVGFAIEVVLGWFMVIWLARRFRPGTVANFRFVPLTLLIVVGAVLFTRITSFQPGIVFGLVAGVTFGTILATAEKAKIALLGLAYSFVVALLAWIGYALLSQVVDPGGLVVFIKETLSSVTIAGIAALPITLIPLRGLSGFEVWSWNRVVWMLGYAIGLLGFFLVLMPMPFAWSGVGVSLWTWVGLYLAYAAVSGGLWLAITRPWKKAPDTVADNLVETESVTAAPE
jgi:hypothetical protein